MKQKENTTKRGLMIAGLFHEKFWKPWTVEMESEVEKYIWTALNLIIIWIFETNSIVVHTKYTGNK